MPRTGSDGMNGGVTPPFYEACPQKETRFFCGGGGLLSKVAVGIFGLSGHYPTACGWVAFR
jgi:hypothetical protein